ncbi:alpha/beta hydrolase [Myxococcota bacterium]|nr:alpha/beta hydrolase [Myxococcota bacterium]
MASGAGTSGLQTTGSQTSGLQVEKDGTVRLGPRVLPPPSTVSPEARTFLAMAPWGAGEPPRSDTPMWTMRAATDLMMKQLSEAAAAAHPVDIEELSIAGVRCHLVKPKTIAPENAGRVLMNLHGGGFVLGGGSLVEAIPVANVAKLPVLAVDYRLAPEHPFPAAVDDARAVYLEMSKHHSAAQIGVYGASTGGFLTAQLVARLRRDGIEQPAAIGVFTAGGDVAELGESFSLYSLSGFFGEPLLPIDHPASERGAYLAGHDPKDPLFAPIRGDLRGWPPCLLLTGGRDALLSATALFHRALRRAEVEAELYCFEAMPHAHWYNFMLPEAREANDAIVRFFRKWLAGPAGAI